MRRPIIKISHNTRELGLTVGFLNACGCPRPSVEKTSLLIRREGCPPPVERIYKTDGCNHWVELVEQEVAGAEYPEFERDCDGTIVFYFDCTLKELPLGRYTGILKTEKKELLSFAIEITEEEYKLESLASEGYVWKRN